MLNSKNNKYFFEGRLIFIDPKGKSGAETGKPHIEVGGKGKIETFSEKYDKLTKADKEKLTKKEDNYKPESPMAAALILSRNVGVDKLSPAEIYGGLRDNFIAIRPSLSNPNLTFKGFWKLIGTLQKWKSITIEPGPPAQFKFYDGKGKEQLFLNIEKGIPIPPATPKKKPKRPTSPGVLISPKKPIGKVGMRKVDKQAEEAEKKRIEKEAQGKKIREEVFGDEALSGARLPMKHRKKRIPELIPDARDGDTIRIKRSATYGSVEARFKNGEWTYTEGRDKGRVKIYGNDRISLARPKPKKALPPVEMKKLKAHGYFRISNNTSWEEIARTVMCTGKKPNGTPYVAKNVKDQNARKNSPQALLEKKDYDPNNAQDVKVLAAFLKEHNGSDKLNVWLAFPKGKNPRVLREQTAFDKEKLKAEANKRTTREVIARGDEDQRTYVRLYKTMITNKDIDIPKKLEDICDDEKLWNYYWKGNFEGKDTIKRAFKNLNVKPNKIREILLDAIQQGHNDIIDFEDLLDSFKTYGVPVYKNHEGEIGDYDEFKEEWKYQGIARRVAKNLEDGKPRGAGFPANAREDWLEFFDDHKDEYEPGKPDIARGARHAELKRVLMGCTLIIDGLLNLDLKVSVKSAERMIEADEAEKERRDERKEKLAEEGKRYERPPTIASKEEIFLQKIFHPQEAQALEDIAGTSYDKASGVYSWVYDEDTRTYFRREMSDATAYRMVKYNASPNGKLDKGLMINELNSYIRQALVNFNALPYSFDKLSKKEQGEEGAKEKFAAMRKHKEDLAKRYGLPAKYLTLQPDFMEKTLMASSIKNNLTVPGNRYEYVRNMITDGYLSSRKIAGGKVEKAEKLKEWTNYGDILNLARHPGTRENIQAVLATNPKPKPTAEEVKKAVEQLDTQFEQPLNAFDINAGVDTNTGQFTIGLSKSVVKIGGFNLKVGFAVNTQTGEPIIGVMASQSIPLTEDWKAEIQGGVGVAVPSLTFNAGARGGFRWTSKGSPTSSMRETVGFGAGLGTSMGLNLTDIYLGPHIYVEAGQRQDLGNQYKLAMAEQLKETGFANVENAGSIQEKAALIKALPNGIGIFMIEAQVNLGWSDKQLVEYYDQHLSATLKKVNLKHVVEDSSVISDWTIGGTIDPIKATIMAAAVASGNPALMALTVAMYVKIGFVIGNKIEVKRELKHSISDKQAEREKEMIKFIESQYPGVEIVIAGDTMDKTDELVSREFAGDQLERMIDREQPAQMKMDEFNPPLEKDFKKLQEKFAQHHLKLSIDPETKMYALQPTEVESFRFYADPGMQNQGIFLKGNKILVATTANLTQLHIKRFDAFYPGTVDGAVQHTTITISDNPYRTMGHMVEHNQTYFESQYDRRHDSRGQIKLKGPVAFGQQFNVLTIDQYRRLSPQQKAYYATSETPTPGATEIIQRRAKERHQIAQTDRALSLPIMLGENIDVKGLPFPPSAFMRTYPWKYRNLTTAVDRPTNKQIEGLEKLITKHNPNITVDQRLLYTEILYQKSMSESQHINREETIKQRINWAEKAVYIPFFKEKLKDFKAKGGEVPTDINKTAKALAAQFCDDLRMFVSNKPVEISGGQSLVTAVGTMGKVGKRTVAAATGQNRELNQFAPGFDYGKHLSAKGAGISKNQRLIARLLLMDHSEIPSDDKEFLQSRLAKKLFFMGKKGEVPNPLADILGKEHFDALTNAYEGIEEGTAIDLTGTNIKAAIDAFRNNVVEKLREAQVDGTPILIDGRTARAVQIGNHYFVIETMIMSGIYEHCKNPASLYNEAIHAFRPSYFEQQLPTGTVTSSAADVTTVATRTHGQFTLGLGVVGTRTFETKPPPKTETPVPAAEEEVKIEIPEVPSRATDPNAAAPATDPGTAGEQGADVG